MKYHDFKRCYKECKNKDISCCVLFSACNDCYYYEKDLICPFCNRKIPNIKWLKEKGCQWCQK